MWLETPELDRAGQPMGQIPGRVDELIPPMGRAYFDVRGNPNDAMTLPDGRTLKRAEAIKYLKASPVPAWMFVEPEGRTVLMRYGSRTRVNEFWKYDLYVAGGGYKQGTFEEYLAKRGLREERPE